MRRVVIQIYIFKFVLNGEIKKLNLKKFIFNKLNGILYNKMQKEFKN